MKELHHYLSTYFGITDADMEIVSSLFEVSHLQKDSFYVKEQQYCDKLSFIQSGYLRVHKSVNKKDITQWISDEGSLITDLSSFIFGNRSRWNIQAITDCSLYTIKGSNYSKLKDLVKNWAEIEKRFMASCFLMLEDRVFQHLSMSAEERYDHFFEYKPALFNQVPLQNLASMLGMTPETFSRIRNKKKVVKNE